MLQLLNYFLNCSHVICHSSDGIHSFIVISTIECCSEGCRPIFEFSMYLHKEKEMEGLQERQRYDVLFDHELNSFFLFLADFI